MISIEDNSTRTFFRQALSYVRTYPIGHQPPIPTLGGRPIELLPSGDSSAHDLLRFGREVAGRPKDLCSLAAGLRTRSGSVADLFVESRDRIAKFNETFGAFEYVADSIAAAEQLDAEAKAGQWRGLLHGIPVSIKDVIHMQGMPTSGSSAAYPPLVQENEGVAVQRLRSAGSLFVGKATSHEFALGVTTPQARNPWDKSRIPGGSSGGSAISIVTGMAAASIGTDTRASIRVPAALTGTVGFKPSFARVPADGLITLSWSMDHVTPMGRSVRDVALLMDVLTATPGAHTSGLPGSLAGTKLAYSPAVLANADGGVLQAFDAVLSAAIDAGAIAGEGPVPSREDLDLANAAGIIVSRCEAATYHTQIGTDLDLCTNETRVQLQEAQQVTASDYLRAQQLRTLLRERVVSAMGDADALIMPTTKVQAPRVEDAGQYLLILSENCIPWSFIDLPAISIPAGMSNGLPVGVQLVGRPGGDAELLALAHGMEQCLPVLPEWTP